MSGVRRPRARRPAGPRPRDRRAGCAAGCPAVAEQTVEAVIAEVPGYAGALSGEMRANIERAVQMALGGFLRLAEQARGRRPRHPAAARARGRVRARPRRGARRPHDGRAARGVPGRRPGRLAGAVRRRWSTRACPRRPSREFAELVFAYIDELSAASVAGHADELATTGRVRELLPRAARPATARAARPHDVLADAAERAGWDPPADADRRPAAGGAGPPGARRARRADAAGCPATSRAPTTRRSLLVPDAAGRAGRGCCGAARARRGRRARPPLDRRRRVGAPGAARAGADRAPQRPRGRGHRGRTSRPLLISADAEALADLRAPGARAAGGARAERRRAARRDAALLAAAPGPPRRRRRRALRAPADGPLPDDAAARAVRRPLAATRRRSSSS